MPRLLALILTALAVVWTVAMLVLPFRAAGGQSPMLTALVYGTGVVICHQRPERSFHARGTRLPVCARCSGLYVAGTLGALAGWIGIPAVPRRTRALLIAAAIPTAITVAAEWAGLAAPSNFVRALAALPLGGAAGWLFVRLLRA
ncbi:MAG: DUF2085 domain-containing protein [Vicinamibacterales bacterium]